MMPAILLLAVLAASEARPVVRLTGEAVTGRWVQLTPDSWGAPERVFEVQDGAGLLAPGRYRLDITTDGGRNEQSDPFTVPAPRSLAPAGKPAVASPPVLDRGDLVLGDGLRIVVTATDSAGLPGGTRAARRRRLPGGAEERHSLSSLAAP